MANIEPKKIKTVLYMTSGEYKGKVCHTVKAADYEIIFQGEDGREKRIIRCRHFEEEDHPREEIIAVDHELTKNVNSGEYIVGFNVSDAKPKKEYFINKDERELDLTIKYTPTTKNSFEGGNINKYHPIIDENGSFKSHLCKF